MIVEAQLSIIFNTHSPCFSVPAVKPSSVHVDLALSSLDSEVVVVDGTIDGETLFNDEMLVSIHTPQIGPDSI